MNKLFIVGKGLSLKGFDLNQLRDEYTICLNHSVFKVPNPSAVCFADKGFLKDNKDFIEGFEGDIFATQSTGFRQSIKAPRELSRLSGLFALEVGLNLADEVYLLGYDLNTTEEYPYFADFSPVQNKETFDKKDGSFRAFYSEGWFNSQRINSFEENFKDRKDRIFNCNKKSGIKIFKFVEFKEII